MAVSVSEEQLNKVLIDVETLIQDVVSLVDQDQVAKKRLGEIQTNPSTGRTEAELDEYLKQRGVKVD